MNVSSMQSMTPEQESKLRKLAEKATPGKEFTAKTFDEAQAVVVVDQKRVIATFFGPEFVWNAHLFAALRNSLPALLSQLEEERKRAEKWQTLFYESEEGNCSCNIVDSTIPMEDDANDENYICEWHRDHPHIAVARDEVLTLAARAEEAEARASRAEQATKEADERAQRNADALIEMRTERDAAIAALAAERERTGD